MNKRALLVSLLVILAVAPAGAGERSARVKAARQVYGPAEDVLLTLQNTGEKRISFAGRWKISDVDEDRVVATITFPKTQRSLRPGGERTFSWPQVAGDFDTSGTDHPTDPVVGPGQYEVQVKTDAGELSDRFWIGKYYTIGFRSHPDDFFVVLNARPKAIAQMDAELEKEESERNLIVSGKVRDHKDYNPDWSYSMGPRTIVLGEVFIEVCDASPDYVEQHKEDWLGDRWCPWSSYVLRAGP